MSEGAQDAHFFGSDSSDSSVGGISQRVQPPGQTRSRLEELTTANRRKDEFLAMLGHELRSPLGTIDNAIRLLRCQAAETPAWQRTHALLQRQVRRMTHLVDDLLDLSGITSGHLRLQLERIDLCVIVRNAIESLESNIRESNHQLTVLLPDEPVWVQGDANRLEQVFVNLLANASRYTNAGGELTVYGHTQGDLAVVRVRDSGIGIEPHVLPHIFDLFWRADEAASRSKAGLGVGLTVVRNLVELHGGSITAASAGTGKGSEFTVYLSREL